MVNYYDILGVPKSASDDDIKKAYRKLAREKHPDKGGNTEEFQKIQKAYEILSDNTKRSEYDNPHQFNNHFDDFNHFPFGNFNKRVEKCGNHTYNCKIKLKDVYTGLTKKFRVKRDKLCESCNIDCSNCGGQGMVTHNVQMGPFRQIFKQNCGRCNGKGKYRETSECARCDNKGVIIEERLIEFVVKRGCENGYYEIFEKWGEQPTRNNQVPGDLVVVVIIEDLDRVFRRRGLDLIYEEKITLKESLIGKELNIPYFENDIKLNSKGFGVINPNIQYTIFGKGLRTDCDKTGNLHIIFKIEYPQKTFTENEIDKLSEILDEIKL